MSVAIVWYDAYFMLCSVHVRMYMPACMLLFSALLLSSLRRGSVLFCFERGRDVAKRVLIVCCCCGWSPISRSGLLIGSRNVTHS